MAMPKAGAADQAALAGAGAGASEAMTAVAEAAAKRTTHATFFISIVVVGTKSWKKFYEMCVWICFCACLLIAWVN
jgi:hypothetical protein